MYLLGVALSLLILWFTIGGYGGDPHWFIDLPSSFIILGFMAAVLTATNSFKVFYAGMRGVMFPKRELSEEMRGRGASLFRLLSKTAGIMTASIATICLISVLAGYSSWPCVDSIFMMGHTITTILVAPIYGLFFIVAVFEPAVFILKKRPSREK